MTPGCCLGKKVEGRCTSYLTETMGPVPTSIRLDRIPSPTASLHDKANYRAAKPQR